MKSIWKFYSKILQRSTWTILILSSIISLSLSIYFLLFFRIRTFDQRDFFLPNGQAMKNAPRIEQIFGNDKKFRVHQQIDLYPALDVIIRHKNQTNMLKNDVIKEVHRLDEFIQKFRLENRTYSQLCAIVNNACMIDGNYLLSKTFEKRHENLPLESNGIYTDTSDGTNGISSFIFGKDYRVINVTEDDSTDYVDEEEEEEEEIKTTSPPKIKQIISFVPLFRLRYALDVSTAEHQRLVLAWERAILKSLNENFRSNLIEISASTSTAVSDTVSGLAREEGIFIAVLFLLFFLFICLAVSFQGDVHTSVGYLSIFAILNFILSSGATFGLLTLFNIEIIEPMALLVFVIAIIDCMRSSIVFGVYHRSLDEYLPSSTTSNPTNNIDIEEILYQILCSSFGSILCSTWIMTFVYLILSWISPIPCIKILCLTFVLYVLKFYECTPVNTFLHGTFFSSSLVLTLKRLESYRHCLTCLPLDEDFYQKIPQPRNEKKQEKKRFTLGTTYQKFLTAFICLISFIVLLFSLWTIPSIDTRLFEDRFLPRNATSLRSYMKSQYDDYAIGPMIMFVIPEPINYQNKTIQKAMSRLLEQCMNETTTNRFKLFWPETETLSELLYSPYEISMRISPYSQNDLIIRSAKKNRSIIVASRFFCQLQTVKGDREDLRTMSNLYSFANESGLKKIFPYSFIFTHYEALGQLRFDISILILILILITFVFTSIYSRSLIDGLIISIHFLLLLSLSFACLYIFHDLTINFANSLWFYLIPSLYLDVYLHRCSSKLISKWIYNRVLFALILSLIIFTFLPIEMYLYHIIHQSLLYQSIITIILLNISLPSWMNIMKPKSKDDELPNLVCESNGST